MQILSPGDTHLHHGPQGGIVLPAIRPELLWVVGGHDEKHLPGFPVGGCDGHAWWLVVRRQRNCLRKSISCQVPNTFAEVLGLVAEQDGEVLAGKIVQSCCSLHQLVGDGEAVLTNDWTAFS